MVFWQRSGEARRLAWAWRVLAVGVLTPIVVPASISVALFRAERLAARRFPLLADFETRAELANWSSSDTVRFEVVRRETDGHALSIVAGVREPYLGGVLGGFPANWEHHRTLEWEARIAPRREPDGRFPPRIAAAQPFVVRLDDDASSQDGTWMGERFEVGPEWRQYRWTPGFFFGRRLLTEFRWNRVVSVVIYVRDAPAGTRFEIDNLRVR
jgi:hypothetical protein